MTTKKEEKSILAMIANAALTLLLTVALSLSTWALLKISEQSENIVRMEEQIKNLASRTEKDESQDSQLHKQWELLSKMKTGLNEVRIKMSLPPVD